MVGTYHTPVTSSLTRTSPEPGEGIGRCLISISAPGPGVSTHAQICSGAEFKVAAIFMGNAGSCVRESGSVRARLFLCCFLAYVALPYTSRRLANVAFVFVSQQQGCDKRSSVASTALGTASPAAYRHICSFPGRPPPTTDDRASDPRTQPNLSGWICGSIDIA